MAEAVAAMGLRFAVITSVNRDDREDGGAELFALTIRAIRERVPGCGVEVLMPDFQGSHAAVETVMDAAPDVFNHNTETVPRLVPPGASGRALRTVAGRAGACQAHVAPATPTKSGLMLGLGETSDEVLAVMRDLRAHQVDILTAGPISAALAQAPADRALRDARRNSTNFDRAGYDMGFAHVESGPLVRSSYHAKKAVKSGLAGESAG